ncbi:MAG: GNAT family N-acetyltransferase [Ornithinibacter sp.]
MAQDRATHQAGGWAGRRAVDDPAGRSQMLVRAATSADVEAVCQLEERCLGADAWSAALVSEGIHGALPTVSYLVAEVDGVVVGHAVTSAAGEIAELQRIAVDEPHRRTGVGAALMDAVVAGARTTEADRLLLEVRVENGEALGFYANLGFVEIDRRTRYYADGTTAVVLRLLLERGGGSDPGRGRAQ